MLRIMALFGLLGLAACVPGAAAPESTQPADRIFTGGQVLTVDADFSVHTALAVRGGRIVAVGTDEQMAQWRGATTQVIDLAGRTLMPGLIDSHTHAAHASVFEFDHTVPTMDSVADVLAYVRTRAAAIDAGAWIVVNQVFITRLNERRYPTREELDAAAPEHPVFFRTGPDASLNMAALKQLSIDAQTLAPAGSKIEKDAAGQPTGILRGWKHLAEIPSAGRTPDEAQRAQRLGKLIADYNRVGLTAIADRSCDAKSANLYASMLERGELHVRVALSRHVATAGDPKKALERIDAIAKESLFREGTDRLRIVGIKTFLDGGMLTGSAFLRRPWGRSAMYAIDDPEYRGIRFIEPDQLEALVERTVKHGLQFTAHAVGDGAVHDLIDAYEKVNARVPIGPTRPCITHCNFMSEQAIAQMAELGIVADIQPAWLYLDAATLEKQFGRDRLRWFQPLQSLFKAGVIAGGGSDHMQKIGDQRAINPYNPFWGMWVTMSRTARRFEGRLHSDEALSRRQAIRFYTIQNAKVLRMEHVIGSLEPGKAADLIVIDRDVMACDLDAVKEIQVIETYVEGQRVYASQNP